MALTVKGKKLYQNGSLSSLSLFIDHGIVVSENEEAGGTVIFSDSYIFPGFADVHVHLREPGFSYKETIKTGTLASAHGGYTAVCSMPNLNPVPDSVENLRQQLDIIEKDACIHVYPYGSITVGQMGEELSDMADLDPNIAAVTAAIEKGKAEAEARELYITHKVIARQSEDIEWFARLSALGKDKLR